MSNMVLESKLQEWNFLSDHKLQVFYTHHFGKIISWNVLMKCDFNESYNSYNNGFGKIETQEEYKSRIDNIVKFLSDIIHDDKDVNIIALQEFPPEMFEFSNHNYFKQQLLENLGSNFGFHNEEKLDTVIVYNTQTFHIVNESTEDFESSINCHLIHNQDRIEFVSLADESNKLLDIYNVHLKGFQPGVKAIEQISVNETLFIINQMIDKTNENHDSLIVGDFNYNVLDYKDEFQSNLDSNHFDIYAEPETTLTYNNGNPWFNTCDGFIEIFV